MQVARYVMAGLAATAVAFGSPGVARGQEVSPPVEVDPSWTADHALAGVRAWVSHPRRWDFKAVAELSRSMIVEGEKRRTGSLRYFVVTRHLHGPQCQTPGTCAFPDPEVRLKVRRVRGPLETVIAVALLVDDAL